MEVSVNIEDRRNTQLAPKAVWILRHGIACKVLTGQMGA